ncbi:CDP-glycerol glycerophosphotransferase (TagB/SpsB family) [Neobacillus bataviensis]|uniref:CDP-glycerol glycerophosphotransferase (TagB/SpsB family) n=1 Tax=Neobacillus bataviensis TaxID=220685 RepID=A0A561CMC5_9BACI|nr:CDP-glycerol glycerophosphotransferase (TagB/SpsB family) [Neobacillus bataviensis]
MRKLFKAIRKPGVIIKRIYHILFNLVGFLPKRENLIIFESFLGKQYSDNPRAIYEYLRDHHTEYDLLWSIDKRYKQTFEELNIPTINRLSIKWLFVMPRAHYWVINSRMPYWIRKPNHTVYLQTWHGTPLKKLAGDMEEVHMPGTTTEVYKNSFFKEARNWDYLISPNPYSTTIFERAFKYERKKILETGYPRNDFLINYNTKEYINQMKETLGIPKDKKVILYAPTWRDNEYYAIGKYKFTLNIDFDQLKRSLGEEYVILLRLHYLIANKIDVSTYKDFVFDFSAHDDIRELYIISDLLITDYSSVFFDYLCLKRPIIFYTYDIDTYRDKLRGFYFDFERDAPGPLVKTTDKLIEAIKKVDLASAAPSETLLRFHKKYCHLENGFSTEKVVKSVFLERATE